MKKKMTAIALVVALLAVAVIGGTLAFFTDTEEVENTFTMGKGVDIDLDEDVTVPEEHKDDPTWAPGEETENGAKYEDIVPGVNYAKNPIITVGEDSQEAYVYAELSVKDYHKLYAALEAAKLTPDDLSKLLVNPDLGKGLTDAWLDDDGTFHIVYNNGKMKAEDEWSIFDAVKVPEEFTQDIVKDLGTITLDIKGYAIQADGVADAADGWAKLGVHTPTT